MLVSEFALYIFFFVCIGLGPSIILEYRMGNLMISDLALSFLVIAIIFDVLEHKEYKIKLNRTFLVFLYIVFFELVLGILAHYYKVNIMQDIKLILYFICPYILIKSKKRDNLFIKRLFIVLIIIGLVVSIEEFLQFFTVTKSSLYDGNISRDVGIIVQILPISSVLLEWAWRNKKVKIDKWVYYGIQTAFFAGCLLSMTRTIWLQLGITYIIYLLYIIKFAKISKVVFLKLLVFLMILSAIVLGICKNYYSLYHNNVVFANFIDRFFSINIINPDPDDTLAARMGEVQATYYKFNNLRIICGYGLGDTRSGILEDGACFTENSIIYYLWKYGIINFIVLSSIILRKLISFFKDYSTTEKVIFISFGIYAVIGNFSGNLNLYYTMPIISMLALYNLNLKEI